MRNANSPVTLVINSRREKSPPRVDSSGRFGFIRGLARYRRETASSKLFDASLRFTAKTQCSLCTTCNTDYRGCSRDHERPFVSFQSVFTSRRQASKSRRVQIHGTPIAISVLREPSTNQQVDYIARYFALATTLYSDAPLDE